MAQRYQKCLVTLVLLSPYGKVQANNQRRFSICVCVITAIPDATMRDRNSARLEERAAGPIIAAAVMSTAAAVAAAATITGGIRKKIEMPDFVRRSGKAMRLVSGMESGPACAAAIQESPHLLIQKQEQETAAAIPATEGSLEKRGGGFGLPLRLQKSMKKFL